jgi:hypothetical protein
MECTGLQLDMVMSVQLCIREILLVLYGKTHFYHQQVQTKPLQSLVLSMTSFGVADDGLQLVVEIQSAAVMA